MPEASRPVVRNYTARRLDRALGELDIDFVLHGHGDSAGPGSCWAAQARPGDKIGLPSDDADHLPPANFRWSAPTANC
jgi:NADPH-dependent ferric siderophore reductase